MARFQPTGPRVPEARPAHRQVSKIITRKMVGEISSESTGGGTVRRKTFILEQVHSCDRFSILKLSTNNWEEVNYYILPPDHEESLISSLIMDGCHWNQYMATYLPAEVQLDQPAYVHPNVLAESLDIPWCRYSHLESSVEVSLMGFCSANDHSGWVNS